MMRFRDSIQYKYGSLKRGERCLWKGWNATYMGSYSENSGEYVHMLRLEDLYVAGDNMKTGFPIMEQHIVQESDKSKITCVKQERQPEKGQMQLC